MLIFEPVRLVFYSDIERCPFMYNSPLYDSWARLNDRRLLLIALERYLMIFDYLRKTNQYLAKDKT